MVKRSSASAQQPPFMRLREAATKTGFSIKRIREAEASGEISFYRFDGSSVNYVKRAELDALPDRILKPKKRRR
jgi:hypothetical protein